MTKKIICTGMLLLCFSLTACEDKSEVKEVQKIYDEIYPNLKEANRLIYQGIEFGEEMIDEKEHHYLEVANEPEYQNTSDLENLLESAFTERYIEENLLWVLGEETPLYKMIDGRLCVLMADAVGLGSPEEVTEVIEKDDTTVRARMIREDTAFRETNLYDMRFVKQNGKWLIDGMEQDVFYHAYFEPVIEEISASPETMDSVIQKWMIPGLDYTEEYADKVYTCEIKGEQYSFDLQEELAGEEEWHWLTAGIFSGKGNQRYICLYDLTPMYEEDTERDVQLLCIAFSADKPEDYQVYSYRVEPSYAFVANVCYQLGNRIYLAGEKELGVIDLDTMEFQLCRQETEALSELAVKEYGEEPYHPFLFRAIREVEGFVIYSAQVSEAMDEEPVHMIYLACKNGVPVAYITVSADSLTEQVKEGIEVEIVW